MKEVQDLSCPCDITYYWVGTCLAHECFIYNLLTVIGFSLALIYVLFVTFVIFSTKRRGWDIRKSVVSLFIGVTVCRVVRYSWLLSKPSLMSKSQQVIVRLLYVIPFCLAAAAYTLMLFVWIQLYHTVLATNSPLKGKYKQNPWIVRCYIIVTSSILLSYLAVIAAETADGSGSTKSALNIFSALVLLLYAIFFMVYGGKVGKAVHEMEQNSGATALSRFNWFHKLNKFSWTTSIYFVIMVIIVGTLGFISNDQLWFFLVRHSIYRCMELPPIYIIVATFQPSFSQITSTISRLSNSGSSTSKPANDNSAVYSGAETLQMSETSSSPSLASLNDVQLQQLSNHNSTAEDESGVELPKLTNENPSAAETLQKSEKESSLEVELPIV